MLGQAAADGRAIDLKGHSERGRDGVTGPRKPGAIASPRCAAARWSATQRDLRGDGERIVLSHTRDRSLFARGALKAALWAHAANRASIRWPTCWGWRGVNGRRARPLQHRHRIAVVVSRRRARSRASRRRAASDVVDVDDAGHARPGWTRSAQAMRRASPPRPGPACIAATSPQPLPSSLVRRDDVRRRSWKPASPTKAPFSAISSAKSRTPR